MPAERWTADGRPAEQAAGAVDDEDDVAELPPGITAAVERLVGEGLGPTMGLTPGRRRQAGVARVARLGPDELGRRLDVLYSTRHGAFVAYATRILGNRDEAEDVVNEAFVRVLRADPDLLVPEALAGYVNAVVRNAARDRGSRNARDRRERERPDVSELADRLVAEGRSLDERVCDEVTLALALAILSERQRQCFDLRFRRDLSVSETARRLQISEGNVKRICHEIKSRLAAVIDAA